MSPPQVPLVTIVTPSYNMAEFLEETILSVLNQDYPRIEYIVMDGGSTDGSLGLLRKYEGRLRHESQPDKGPADAVNRGFRQSSGEIFAFLNADDTYLPGAVSAAVRHMLANPGCAGIYGEGYLVDVKGRILGPYPTRKFDPDLFRTECFICQPSAFLWRNTFEEAGMLDLSLGNGFDHDLWIRIAKRRSLLKVDDYLATSRMHRGAKTFAQRRDVYRNSIGIVKRHYGYVPFPHIYGYCCSLLDRRDGFFESVPASIAKYVLSFAYGTLVNSRHLGKFWRECIAAGVGALRRGSWPRRHKTR